MPAPDSGDNFVRIGGPGNGRWFGVVFGDEGVDGALQVDDRDEDASLQAPVCELCEKAFHGVSHEHDVDMKWKVKRSCFRPPRSSLIALVNVFSGYVLAGLRVLSAIKSEDCRMLASDDGSAEVVDAIGG